MTHIWTPPRNRHNIPESEANHPTWLELFYDLVFVAVFIQIGDLISQNVTWLGVGQVLVLFVPLWWVWANFTWYMNQFHVDDVWHRLLLIVQIFFVAWMGITVTGAFGESGTQFVLCYIGFRLTMIAMYARSLQHWPEARPMMKMYILNYHFAGAVFWGLSLLLPPGQRWMVWIGVFLWELYNSNSKRLAGLLERFPVHIEHLAERYGTLIILVLGESFIKSITVSPSPPMTAGAVIYSFPGILLVFALWWLYFEDAHAEEHEGKPFLSAKNAVAWLHIHLPLSLVLISFGVAKKKLFEAVGGGYLKPEYVALFLGSLALYCLFLTLIAQNRSPGDTLWRIGAAIVLLLLIPGVVFWHLSATTLMLLSALVIGMLVIREVWQVRRRLSA